MSDLVLLCLKVLGVSIPVLLVLGLALWERRRAGQAESLLNEVRAADVVNTAVAKGEALRVEGLELERARAVVAAYEEAKKRAAGENDANHALESANAVLARLSRANGGTPSGDPAPDLQDPPVPKPRP